MKLKIEKIAQITNEFIQDSHGVIVTEYCKKEETWTKYKNISYSFSREFLNDLVKEEFLIERLHQAKKEEKTNKDLNVENEIVNLGGAYWRNLIAEGIKRQLLAPNEISLLNIAASIDMPNPRIASPKQAKLIWKIRDKLDNNGVLV